MSEMSSLKSNAALYFHAVLNSYSQIFFSQQRWFGVSLLLLSFFDMRIGLGGLSAVVLTNFLAHILGFSHEKIRTGFYGFNAVFLGMSMVNRFYVTPSFLVFFFFSVLVVFMLTVLFEAVFSKRQLPFLILPFVFTMFIVDLSFFHFSNIVPIHPFERFTVLLAKQMSVPWYGVVHAWDNAALPQLLYYFFKTLASALFSDSLLVGILIALILLFHSRIKFTVALLGFAGAFWVGKLLGVDIQHLTVNLAGTNYIFWGIALGSFFIVPNVYSYLLVAGLTPALFLFYASTENLISRVGLSSWTLSFSIFSILVLIMLKQRVFNRFFLFPYIYYDEPEKTVYKRVNYMQRFANDLIFKMQLPFWGEWSVSQGHDGGITHLGEWGKALDFVITDADGNTYSGTGFQKEDYFCYDKPVLAPADGYVYQISNIIDDNDISNVNVKQNWGNSIVINHLNGLYTQISHLKKDSFKVNVGDYVTKGTLLAACGNSGRSPEPHIHFQTQLSPEIGYPTHTYPIGYFFEKQADGSLKLNINKAPRQNTVVMNVTASTLLKNAFDCKPGRKVKATFNNEDFEWEFLTDAYNKTYIQCPKTKSRAYMVNDDTMFYFVDFEGNKSSPLYYFYRACFKILLSNEKNILIEDNIPLTKENRFPFKWLQDFFAPFILFKDIVYTSKLTEIDNIHYPEKVVITAQTRASLLGKRVAEQTSKLEITKNQLSINSNKNNLCVVW